MNSLTPEGRQRRRLLDLMDCAPMGYAVLRRDGSLHYANRTLVGWLQADSLSLGRDTAFTDLLTRASRTYFDTHVRPLLTVAGTVEEIALELQSATGERVPVLLNASSHGSEEGEHLTQLALQRVVERRRYEKEVLSERRRAEDALAQLQDVQLQLVETMQINAMATLSSSLAHELNQPLTAVVATLAAVRHMMHNGPGSERLQLAIAEAEQEALRAGEIIRRVRSIGEGAVATATTITVAELIEGAIRSVGAVMPLRVSPEVSVRPANLQVHGNVLQLQYVLAALLQNAAEASAASVTPRVVVSATEEAGEIVISISDNGEGVDAGVRADLFRAFLSTKPQRRGISLANCRTVVEAHGGRISETDSADLGGACFTIALPERSGT